MLSMLFTVMFCYGEITISKDSETGIVTISQTTNDEIGRALRDAHLNIISTDDYAKITSANGFILNGPFSNDPDLMQLSQKNGSITYLDMGSCNISPNNLMIPAVWKSTLEEYVVPTHSGFDRLPQNFLYGFRKIQTLVIPANVKTIENGALGNMTISEITIPATLERIKEGAFKETIVLHDVYVESRNTICEMKAFDFETLVGQTSIENIYTYAAKLHYPDTPEDYEYFVGSWKEGRTISQDNLNGFKDGLYGRNEYGFWVKLGPNNGWQQFALADNAEPFVMTKDDVRTYSDNIEHDYLPTGNEYEIRVYRATGYDKNGNIILQRVYGSWGFNNKGNLINYNCIPTNTGVIIKVHIKDNGKNYIHYFANTNNHITQYPWKWGGNNNSYGNNFLEVSITPTEVHPVWPWPKTANPEYRNFALVKDNGQYKWSRLTSSTMRANRAYLKLPTTVFTNNNEGPGDGPGNNTNLAKVFNMFSTTTSQEEDGPNSVGLVFPEEDDYETDYQLDMYTLVTNPFGNGGIATNVNNAVKREDNNYYTLQGIRVKNPSNGVYIKNGKKVIVK